MASLFEPIGTTSYSSNNLDNEPVFQVRKDGFKDNPSVLEELDLVEEDDQFTHMLMVEDVIGGDEILNVFQFDAEYAANEEKYKSIKKELLDQSSSSGSYRVAGHLVDLGFFRFLMIIMRYFFSAPFCLGWWESGRMGRSPWQ